MAPINLEYEENILAAIVCILTYCTPEEAFVRLEKGGHVSSSYDEKLSVRENAKNMGISPTTVQKTKKNQYIQASLF